jgi:hypothetical protein
MNYIYVVSYFNDFEGVFSSEAKAEAFIDEQNDGQEFEPGDWSVDQCVIDERIS